MNSRISPGRRACALALLFTLATTARAQHGTSTSTSTNAPAESASVARESWARAGSALAAHDEAAARRAANRAAAAWPTQPAYLWASAVLAAHAHDTAATRDALAGYARLGLGRDFQTDSVLAAITRAPAFAALAATHAANRAPIVRSTVRASLPDSTFWPEGMDVDARTGRIYVASVRHRTIAELRPDGTTRELWPRGRHDLGAILGVRVDSARGVLWATTSGIRQTEGYIPADSAIGALLRIRIADGAIEQRWNVGVVRGGHVLGDLAIGPRGDLFMTDSNEPVLYRLPPNGTSLEAIRSPLFHSLQGMAPTPDGRALYLSDYSIGLLRVDLATGAVTRVDDAPSSTSLGCDGIAWDRGAIVAVQNGVSPARIVRFVLDAAGSAIVRLEVLDRNSAIADEPTIGAVLGRTFVYVANSQWDKHDDDGRLRPGHPLTRPVLLSVPLPP